MRRAKFLQQGLLAIDAASWGLEFELGPEPASFRAVGNAAIVDICGPLTQHATFFFDNYDAIKARVAEALASECSTIVLNIDSPGGDVAGVFELSRQLRRMAKTAGKQIVAYADGKALSAGYAIACAADRIYVSETAFVGSVGCCAMLLDVTAQDRQYGLAVAVLASGKRKSDGNPHVALSEEMIEAQQAQVDSLAALFFNLVAKARNMTPEAVKGLEAATFHGDKAVRAGLADEVALFDDLLASIASGAVQATGSEEQMDYKELVAALKSTAEGDNEEEAKKCRAALKAMGEDDGDDEKKDNEQAADESGDDDDQKKKDEETSAVGSSPAVRAASEDPASDMARELAAANARINALEVETLLEKRTDLPESVRKWLSKKSAADVKSYLAEAAKGSAPRERQGTRGAVENDDLGLTARELERCKAKNIDPKKYAANKAAMTGQPKAV